MDLFMKSAWTRTSLTLALVASTLACGRQEVDIATLASNSDQVIWEAGQKALKGKQWDIARQHFRRIVDGFPQSPLVPQARIAAGDARRLADIERFRAFSDGFAVEDRRQPGFVGDARYAMLPTRIAPIWGLQWGGPGAATEFVSRHEFTPAMRGEFFAMLFGRELPVAR